MTFRNLHLRPTKALYSLHKSMPKTLSYFQRGHKLTSLNNQEVNKELNESNNQHHQKLSKEKVEEFVHNHIHK
jgi:hypothetical protein